MITAGSAVPWLHRMSSPSEFIAASASSATASESARHNKPWGSVAAVAACLACFALSSVAIEYYQANAAAEDIPWPRMGADADSLPKFIVTAAAHRLASPFTQAHTAGGCNNGRRRSLQLMYLWEGRTWPIAHCAQQYTRARAPARALKGQYSRVWRILCRCGSC